MAEPKILKTPTNDNPVRVDAFPGTATAGDVRHVIVSAATASILVTVTASDGKTPMGFWLQDPDGVIADGDTKTEAAYFAPGSRIPRTASREDPSRGKVDAVAWSLFIAGDEASPQIQVISDFNGCP